MNRFEFARPASVAEALSLVAEEPGSALKAGGIDLLDHLKEHLAEPPRLVDLKSVPGLDGITAEADGSLRIGPLVTMARIAAHPGIRATHPGLAQACGEAASPQIRNVATIGGNLLQRPRCWYYWLASYRCLKKGGDACFAVGGENRYHTIFADGACSAAPVECRHGDHCIRGVPRVPRQSRNAHRAGGHVLQHPRKRPPAGEPQGG